MTQGVNNLLVTQETQFRSLLWEDSLKEEMATDSCILTWKIPWTEELDELQSTGLQRVRHGWAHALGLACSCTREFPSLSLVTQLLELSFSSGPTSACTGPSGVCSPPRQDVVKAAVWLGLTCSFRPGRGRYGSHHWDVWGVPVVAEAGRQRSPTFYSFFFSMHHANYGSMYIPSLSFSNTYNCEGSILLIFLMYVLYFIYSASVTDRLYAFFCVLLSEEDS